MYAVKKLEHWNIGTATYTHAHVHASVSLHFFTVIFDYKAGTLVTLQWVWKGALIAHIKVHLFMCVCVYVFVYASDTHKLACIAMKTNGSA